MKKIPLDKGLYAIVDAEDFELLSRFEWVSSKMNKIWYARRYIYRKSNNSRPETILMHRQILNAPVGIDVDHINRNGLDNRRTNLRYCTVAQNQHNQFSIRGTSKFKGVYWSKGGRKWYARIRVAGKLIHLGGFDIEEEAAKAYDGAATKHFGEFARTNEMMKLL